MMTRTKSETIIIITMRIVQEESRAEKMIDARKKTERRKSDR